MEELIRTVRVSGVGNSLALTLPAELRNLRGFNKGDRFAVYSDGSNRIVYEKLAEGAPTATNRRAPSAPASAIGGMRQ